jgi:single-strand DNA-binding protein
MYINKAMIYGNLTRDPELKALPSGMAVASFAVATNRTWKDKNGAKQDSVEYHNIVAFGKQAELIHQYVRKGQPIFLEGRIQTRSWDDKDGTKKYRTEIVIDSFQFGPKGGSGEYSGGASASASAPAKAASAHAKQPAPDTLDTIEYPEEDINPDDIPF